MALAYLFGQRRRRPVGIASTAGNVPVQQVCQNNLGLLELCRIAGVPVSKGSEQPVSHAAAHRRGHPRPQGLGYAHVAVDGSAAHRARRRARRGSRRRTPIPASWSAWRPAR